MFENFFKTAYRNLSKNKFFTILNVFGLALGMSLSLLFIALLAFLNRYDDFHVHSERIYRVTTQLHDHQENPRFASAPIELAQQLEDNFTGVEKVVRINRSLFGDAIYGDKKIQLWGYFADPAFFEIFSFPFVQGNALTALTNPNTIVLSETEALKIFGEKEAIGEMIRMDPYGEFLVTGVFRDVPENSHIQFAAIASYSTLKSHTAPTNFLDSDASWRSFENSYVYMRLFEDSDPDHIQHSLNEIAEARYAKEDVKVSFTLQELDSIVPGPQLFNSLGHTWNHLTLFLTALITLIVLIPACSNYINLSISQSLERMKEIGVRKVMGGQKEQIFFQFIVESTTIVLVALLLSYLIYEAVRKEILTWVETSPLDLSPTWLTFLGFFVFALLVGVAAGIVPALYFSKISPIDALKGKEVKTSSRSYFRKIVLTSQFMLSLGFIMAVVIVLRQYQYSVNYDFGFEQENILDVELQHVDPQLFKNEYGSLSTVERISMSSHILGISIGAALHLKSADGTDSIAVSAMAVDEDFIPNMNLELLAGRSFGNNALANAQMIVVNEEFIKKLNPANPLAALDSAVVFTNGRVAKIGGVLKNFHFAGLKEEITPFYFEYDPARFRYANIKLGSGDDVMGQISGMQALWKKIGGEGAFTAQLFSHEIKDAYHFYIMIMKLWGFLGLLAITVACLGLLGTVSFTTKKRFKEISIRKVLGASSESLVLLLSKDFIILMIVASIITIPVVYFLFTHLLANTQHYSIEIGFLEIFVSLLIMLILGFITILSQTLKAANANPVDNLRSE